MLNGGSMVWGFCVYFVYMIPLETDVLRKHRFQKNYPVGFTTESLPLDVMVTTDGMVVIGEFLSG